MVVLRHFSWLWIVLVLGASVAQASDGAGKTELGIREYSDLKNDLQATSPTKRSKSTADHSKFKKLEGPFADGPAVTKACLSCHNKAGQQFKKSIHWTWEYKHPKTGQVLGKKHLVNNFCTNARGNEGMCAQCHAGYGWKDEHFDFNNENNMDCIVCHDGTGTYYKTPTSKGNAACSIMFEGKKPIEWTKVAQGVALPNRQNCGGCHFYGGGGDGVKHGDLDSSLLHPNKSLDVHMDEAGLNFGCPECHVASEHSWAGSRYDMMAKDEGEIGKPGQRRDVATCESCHTSSPHSATNLKGIKLNGHVDRVACQTCHIATFARGGVATKMDWDWRTAGKLINGEGFQEHDYTQGNGVPRATYKSIKGSFKYGENVVPTYAWFDGVMNYTTIDTTFPDAKSVNINSFNGAFDDPKSRIWPFKKMHTIQPYDKGNATLVYMHLWGEDKDSFWGNYDFARAIKVGMENGGLPYSGEYGFIDTYSYWPITHMVGPKEDALACAACHAKQGRLSDLQGFYMPGRDNYPWLDTIGYLAVLGALVVAFGHGGIRYVLNKKSAGNMANKDQG